MVTMTSVKFTSWDVEGSDEAVLSDKALPSDGAHHDAAWVVVLSRIWLGC